MAVEKAVQETEKSQEIEDIATEEKEDMPKVEMEEAPENVDNVEIEQESEDAIHDFQQIKQHPQAVDKPKRDLDFLLDIPLEVSVEIGRTKLLINDLLKLGQGSVIELDKLAGEPMEILVNNKLIARGEVVVVNEKFGVRLTDIISPMERVQKLA